MTVESIEVALGDRAYPIHIGRDLFAQAQLLASLVPGSQAVIVTNETVGPLYADQLLTGLRAAGDNKQIDVITLPDGEEHKTLDNFEAVLSQMLALGHHRSTTVIALGGGVVGDLAGFAASAFHRGVNFVQIPTTLLAQVDSSVGGKTAVNHPLGKNLIGAFYQPTAVLADLNVLDTLPEREFAAGLAEVLKYGVIADAEFFAFLEANTEALLQREDRAMSTAIRRSCEVKAEIVAEDEREQGKRALLNYGHTFGHAIEKLLGYGELLHGEAVAVGMVMAADLSVRQGWLPPAEAQRIKALIAALGLPTERPRQVQPKDMQSAFLMDKKVTDGTVRFIVTEGIGSAFVSDQIEQHALEATLNTDALCGTNG